MKQFQAYLWFVGWDCISLGGHICVSEPNIEIHLPFCFIRIGWETVTHRPINYKANESRKFELTTEKFLDN